MYQSEEKEEWIEVEVVTEEVLQNLKRAEQLEHKITHDK
jgi:hypothetical protein